MSRGTAEDFAREVGETKRTLLGMIRRMVVTLSDEARWQLLGVRGSKGGDEAPPVEPFTGIGFYSRPSISGNPEVIAVGVGGTRNLAIVALRDEKTRQAVVGDLKQDETAMFSTLALVYIRADGTIEARSANGTAVALALKSDVVSVDNKYNDHTHLAAGSPTSEPLASVGGGGAIPNPPNPAFPMPDSVHPFLSVPSGTPTTDPYSPGVSPTPATIVGTTILLGE